MIKNIKSSVIYLTDKNWKKIVLVNVENACLKAKESGNIFIIKGKDKKNFCIIKRKELCKNQKFVYIHINISGVKSVNDLSHTIFFMQTNILPAKSLFKSIFIDNITFSFDLERKLNLEKLFSIKDLRLNLEKFPGAFLKLERGTFVIFQSGKCVLLGCKNYSDINNCLNNFYSTLQKFNI